jgi:DNA-binding beta-propeller fold protein YncE
MDYPTRLRTIDEKTLLVAYENNFIAKLDLETGKQTYLDYEGDRIDLSMDLSPNGKIYIMDKKRIDVYTLGDNQVRTLTRSPEKVKNLCLSPDGAQLFVMCIKHRELEDGALLQYTVILVLDAKNGSFLKEIGETTAPSYGMCVSPDGELLFVMGETGQIRVFSISNGEKIRQFGDRRQFVLPRGICISKDGSELYITEHNRVQVIRSIDGSHVRTIGEYVRGATNTRDAPGYLYRPEDVCLSPDGSELYVADSGNDRIQVFQL